MGQGEARVMSVPSRRAIAVPSHICSRARSLLALGNVAGGDACASVPGGVLFDLHF